MKKIFSIGLQASFLFFLLLSPSLEHKLAQAEEPEIYGSAFGLFVDERNKDLAIPRSKGMQVLQSFFSGSVLKASADGGKEFMSQRDFLLWFEKHRLIAEGKEILIPDDLLYTRFWLQARRHNWLPDTTLTYGTMKEFFYRYSVSQKYGGIPYFEGLVMNSSEINVNVFTSINEVRKIKNKLSQEIRKFKNLTKLTNTQRLLLSDLESNRAAFDDVEIQLKILESPLYKIPNLPLDIREKIIANNLNQVLDSLTYDYSGDTANRSHNLLTGLHQISGNVYQSGEIINFTDVLGKNGWGMYKYGWVILGGKEAWEFGGGLCGSATLVFTPSFRAGLEIVSRHPHSIYYHTLYPPESMGLDATIYRGSKNLIMRNNTGSPILYYAQDDTEHKKVTMYLIGNSPYTSVEIEGPVREKNIFTTVRKMKNPDGSLVEDELITKYNMIR